MPPTEDIRCSCRRLLAKRRGDAIELKCRRCGHCTIVPLTALGAEATPIDIDHEPHR